MTRGSLAKLVGGLALLAPISSPAWSGEKDGRPASQIYSPDQIVKQAVTQQPAAEQAKPPGTQSGQAAAPADSHEAAANGGAAAEEESVGTLHEYLRCNGLASWIDCNRVKVSGHLEQSFTWNPDKPHDRQNFGRLFDDRSNDYRWNQLIVTAERALDPQPCCSDWGFKAQFMYGSDARFIHSLGFMDNVTNDTVQPDIVEAFATYHAPVLTDGGVDFKVGQFVTLMGAEVIYAPANPLFSHSYIFNFGIPFKHTGFMATFHLSDCFHLHAGLVNGINTGSFDDNNDVWAFHGGWNWDVCKDVLSVNGSFHAGPENDGVFNLIGVDSNDDFRYIETMQIVYKPCDNVTTITDINIGKDEGFDAEWYGVAQYFIYQINKCTSFVTRLEIWRDDDGFAAISFAENDDFIDLERGEVTGLDPRTVGGGDTTYTSLTLGLNIKPYENLLFRPEVRMDWADHENAPFDDSSDNNQFTAGVDMIWFF